MKEYTGSTDALDELVTYASAIPDGPRKTIPGGSMGSTDYLNGTVEYQTLPAAWWNWLISKLTENEGKTASWLTNLYPELESILSAASISPDATVNDQLLTAILHLCDTGDLSAVRSAESYTRRYVSGTSPPDRPYGTVDTPEPFIDDTQTYYSEGWFRQSMIAGSDWTGASPVLGIPASPKRFVDQDRAIESEGWIRQTKDADLQTQINNLSGSWTPVGGKFVGSVIKREDFPLYMSEVGPLWGASTTLLQNDWGVVSKDTFYQDSSSVYIYQNLNTVADAQTAMGATPFSTISPWLFKYSDISSIPERHLMRFEIRIFIDSATDRVMPFSMTASFNLFHTVGQRNIEIRHEGDGEKSLRVYIVENRGTQNEIIWATLWDRTRDAVDFDPTYWKRQPLADPDYPDQKTYICTLTLFNENSQDRWISDGITQAMIDSISTADPDFSVFLNAFRIDHWTDQNPAGCGYWFPELQWIYAYSSGAGAFRHQDLTGRSLPDQHPLSAITDGSLLVPYTYIIDSNAALQTWLNEQNGQSALGLTKYRRIYVKTGTYTASLFTTRTALIDWQQNQSMVGENNTILEITASNNSAPTSTFHFILGSTAYGSTTNSASQVPSISNVSFRFYQANNGMTNVSSLYGVRYLPSLQRVNITLVLSHMIASTSAAINVHCFSDCHYMLNCAGLLQASGLASYTFGAMILSVFNLCFRSTGNFAGITAYCPNAASILSAGFHRCQYVDQANSAATGGGTNAAYYIVDNISNSYGVVNCPVVHNYINNNQSTRFAAAFYGCYKVNSCWGFAPSPSYGTASYTLARYGFYTCNQLFGCETHLTDSSFGNTNYTNFDFASCRMGHSNLARGQNGFNACYNDSTTNNGWPWTAGGNGNFHMFDGMQS